MIRRLNLVIVSVLIAASITACTFGETSAPDPTGQWETAVALVQTATAQSQKPAKPSPPPKPKDTLTAAPIPTSIPTETPPPVLISTSAATSFPTKSIPPVLVQGWEEADLKTVCLTVEQSYPGLESKKTPEPIFETAQRILSRLDIYLVEEEESCEADISLALTGHAKDVYFSKPDVRCYQGASVEGEMTLISLNYPTSEINLEGVEEIPYITYSHECHKNPWEAPFHEAWIDALQDGLSAVWGVEVLISGLEDNEPYIREASIQVITDKWPEAELAYPALIQALGDENYGVQIDAKNAFEVIGSKSVPYLIDALTDVNPTIRENAAEALGDINPRPHEATTTLLTTLNDQNANVRAAVVSTLGYLIRTEDISEEITNLILQSLEDEDPRVRASTARILDNFGPYSKVVLPALIKSLKDEDETVRSAAAHGIGWLRLRKEGEDHPEFRDAVPVLSQALEDEYYALRENAAFALGNIGPDAEESVPGLVHMLSSDGYDQARSSAAQALGRIGFLDDDVKTALIEALGDEYKYARNYATIALGEFKQESWDAVPALIAVLEDELTWIRKDAAEALQAITGQDFGEDADAWQEYWNAQQ